MDECKPLPTGRYRLNLSVMQERAVAERLLDLTKREGQGLTFVPISAQIEHFLPPYNSTQFMTVSWNCSS